MDNEGGKRRTTVYPTIAKDPEEAIKKENEIHHFLQFPSVSFFK